MNISTAVIVLLISSLEVQAYKHYTLENPDLCSETTKRRLKLQSGIKSAMIVNQTRIGDHVIPWTHDLYCKFELKTENKRDGIFAVIHTLDFRVDPWTKECIDYVQFKGKNGVPSNKFCGQFDAIDVMKTDDEYPNEFVTENAFIDAYGELDVHIFVSKDPLDKDESTDINIVFTTFKPCSRSSKNDRPCSEIFNDKCISKEFIHDGFFNCPFINCPDENGCESTNVPKALGSIGNKVLIGSVASMLLSFGIFICCIYLCRKYGKFCWSPAFASPPTPTTVAQAPQVVPVVAEPPTPSAPVSDDKDLPPSYDSLFPSNN